MNIIVLVKQVPNPEIPPNKFKIDPATNKVVPPEGVPPVISPFDEQAVEGAVRLKEQARAKVTVISMGQQTAKDVVKHALSMGADEGIVLSDKAFEGSDSFATAHILTKAIEKLGDYDVILCGRQAADWDAGQVGSIIAENLGLPIVTRAKSIEAVDGKLKVEHVIADGYEVFEVPLPAVVTVSNEIGLPRLPSGMGIITAARKQIPVWTAADIGVDANIVGAGAVRTKLHKLFIPVREAKCEIMEGKDAAEAAANLALKLREAKII